MSAGTTPNRDRVPIELARDSSHPEVTATFEKLRARSPVAGVSIANIHRTLANSPVVFGRFIDFAHALRYETTVDPAERELAIICVLECHHGEYELVPHRKMALQLGLSQQQVDNVRNPATTAVYNERQRAILQFAECFAADPNDTARRDAGPIVDHLDNRQRIELGLILALYLGLAHFTGTIAVPRD